MNNHTARHFVLQLGSLVSLYLSLAFLLVLIFGLVHLAFPGAADRSWEVESAVTQVRLGIAMVVVFFPTYVILTRLVNQTRRSEPTGSYLGLTKWLIYLSLLGGGAVLLGDLVAVIMAFLEGDMTIRFVLKALSVLIVVGAAFSYYLLDAKEYWLEREAHSKLFGVAAGAMVLGVVVTGFFFIDTPAEARERELDEQQIRDLQAIQGRIQNYLTINEELPPDVAAAYTNASVPTAPNNRPPYMYWPNDDGFALCATFSTDSRTEDYPNFARPPNPTETEAQQIVNPDDWQYQEGRTCFTRVVR